MNRRDMLRMLGATIVGATSKVLWAQNDKPLRIVVPYSAGGTTDIMARLLAVPVAKTLRRTVIVDNRPGATALIGTRVVQTSPPDGDTLLFHNEGLVLYPLLNKDAGYDPIKDFTPVSVVAWASNMLVVNSSVPANNLAEFIAWAKTQPNGVEAANAGLGSSGHLQTVSFARMAGIKVLHVPYKGSAETANAVIAGQVKMQLTTTTGAINAAVKAGKVKILATASKTRVPFAPDLPSISEAVPGFDHRGWFGLLASAGTPPDAVTKLNHAFNEAMADPAIREKFLAIGMEPATGTPDEFASAVRGAYDRFNRALADETISVH